mgnify:FL=1
MKSNAKPRAPLVSVVIPTHNRVRLLEQCLDSVLRQTLGDREIIVVDDASSDETARFLRQAKQKNLTSIRLGKPSGCTAARAIGARRARGRYVAFLDDDDMWNPRKLELQLERMETSGAMVSHCDFDIVDLGGKTLYARCHLNARQPGPGPARRPLKKMIDLYRNGHIPEWPTALFSSLVLERGVFQAVGSFDLRFKRLNDDTDFWLRLYRAYGPERVDFTPRSLVKYRFHPGQISAAFIGHGAGRGGKPALEMFNALVDNALFLDKVRRHEYCARADHVCRRLRTRRFPVRART